MKDLAELMAFDKANPGKLAFATDGPRNLSGMLAAWLNKLGGSNILQVPYATMPQGVQDTLAGRVQLSCSPFPPPPSRSPTARCGRSRRARPSGLRTIRRCRRSRRPSPASNTSAGSCWWRPPARRTTSSPASITRWTAPQEPELSGKLADLGFFTTGADTLPALSAYLRTQFDLWRRLTHDIGLQPE